MIKRTLAAVAAATLAASVTTLSPAGATPVPQGGAFAGFHHQRLDVTSVGNGRPRVLQNTAAGLPAGAPTRATSAFLLRLGTSSTLTAYHRGALRSRATARTDAQSQFRRIKTAQEQVIAHLPGSA